MSRGELAKKNKLESLLLEQGRPYAVGKQQILQSTEDRQVVNLVVSGFVRKYLITNDGSIGVMIVYGPGDIFPLTLTYSKLFGQQLYSGSETFFYEAMAPTEVRTIDADTLYKAVLEDPEIYKDLYREAGRHLEFCIQSIENIALRNSGKRIAHFLLYFARKFGTKTKEGIQIEIPMSHQSIGELLNLTRETVTTNMIKMRKKKLIKTDKRIVVTNLKALEEEAYG